MDSQDLGCDLDRSKLLHNHSKRKICAILTIVVVIATVLITSFVLSLSIGLSVRNRQNNESTDLTTGKFSPGDTLLYTYSAFFCKSVFLKVDGMSDATVYLVDSKPLMSNVNNFTITSQATLKAFEFIHWHYYLYSDSTININSCSEHNNDSYSIHIIRGDSNAEWWSKTESMEYVDGTWTNSGESTNNCGELGFKVLQEDNYYIIVQNSQSTELAINMTLSISRYGYTRPENLTTVQFCQAQAGASCSVDIPYGSGTQTALVGVDVTDSADWTKGVTITAECTGRAGSYVLIVSLSVLFVLVMIAVVVRVVGECSELLHKL